jgi:extradiol dioxygenase family protein
MGFEEGKSAKDWIDFNMFGHQFVVHLSPQLGKAVKISSIANSVDGQGVPVPHFGVVMNFNDWEVFAQKASQSIDEFIIEPQVRFKGEVGEQATMFFSDASGNALEFKGFKNI